MGASLPGLSREIQNCVEICTECHDVCLELVDQGLRKGGAHADADHMRILADGADACRLAASFLVRNTRFLTRACRLCADICEECAADCDRFMDDPALKRCGDLCRLCAQCCHKMAWVTGG